MVRYMDSLVSIVVSYSDTRISTIVTLLLLNDIEVESIWGVVKKLLISNHFHSLVHVTLVYLLVPFLRGLKISDQNHFIIPLHDLQLYRALLERLLCFIVVN